MYDASCAAPPCPFRYGLTIGFALVATLIVLLILVGSMFVPGDPVLAYVGAGLAGIGTVSAMVDLRGKAFDIALGGAFASLVGFALVTITIHQRGDYEIEQDRYRQTASLLRARPELSPLLASARVDGVITNDEWHRFNEDVAAFDRDKALGR